MAGRGRGPGRGGEKSLRGRGGMGEEDIWGM